MRPLKTPEKAGGTIKQTITEWGNSRSKRSGVNAAKIKTALGVLGRDTDRPNRTRVSQKEGIKKTKPKDGIHKKIAPGNVKNGFHMWEKNQHVPKRGEGEATRKVTNLDKWDGRKGGEALKNKTRTKADQNPRPASGKKTRRTLGGNPPRERARKTVKCTNMQLDYSYTGFDKTGSKTT